MMSYELSVMSSVLRVLYSEFYTPNPLSTFKLSNFLTFLLSYLGSAK